MSFTDGLGKATPTSALDGAVYALDLAAEVTLSADLTLTKGYRQVLGLDPGGANRDVLLPPEEHGLWYYIRNRADAAENLVVKEDSDTTTIATLNQNEAALFWCDGTTWRPVSGILTASLT